MNNLKISKELEAISKLISAASFDVGDWVCQEGSDWKTYALICEEMKNGSFKGMSFTSYNESTTGKPAYKSLKGWDPVPKKCRENDVPRKIADKIEKKAKQMGKI